MTARVMWVVGLALALLCAGGCDKKADDAAKPAAEKKDDSAKKEEPTKKEPKKDEPRKAEAKKDTQAPGDKDAKEKAAIAVAGAWLKLIDEGKYDDSWDQTSKQFQGAVKKDKWPDTIKAARTPFGKHVQREVTSKTFATELPGAPDGEYVVIIYTGEFEKKKKSIETITPMFEDGKWKVSGYYIK